MTNNVRIIFFDQKINCQYCGDAKQLLQEVASLSDKITLEEASLLLDATKAAKYGVDKAPAIVVTDEAGSDSGVIFSGIPAGYEFMSLIGAIFDRGAGTTGLSAKTQEEVKNIDSDVRIQVFVTPGCPYCYNAVRAAHQMAFLNPKIKAEMVEATEFPELSNKYRVMAVPKTVINGKHSFEGAYPEARFLQEVKKAVASVGATGATAN